MANAFDRAEYEWVDHGGQKVKKWKITNKKYGIKSEHSRKIASKTTSKESFVDTGAALSASLIIGGGFGFSQVEIIDKVNDSNGKFASENYYNLEAKSSFRSNRFEYLIGAGLRGIRLKPGVNAKFVKDETTLKKIEIGFKYNSKVSLGLFVSHQEYSFINTEGTVFNLDKTALPSVKVLIEYNIYRNPKWELGTAFEYRLISSGTLDEIKIEKGSLVKAGLYTKRKLETKSIVFGVEAHQRKQNTSVSEQSELGILLNGAVLFDF